MFHFSGQAEVAFYMNRLVMMKYSKSEFKKGVESQ